MTVDGRNRLRLIQGGASGDPPEGPGMTRWAGDALSALFAPGTYQSWEGAIGRRIPLKGLGVGLGTAGITGLMSAIDELNSQDPTRTGEQKIGGALGAGALGTGGAVLGGILGGMTPLGPLGSVIGAGLLGSAGSALGGGAGRAVAGVFGPSPEDRALQSYQRQSDAALAAEVKRAGALMPLQQRAAQFALANEVDRASKMQMIQSMADAFRQQQLASAQQSLAATQGMFTLPYG